MGARRYSILASILLAAAMLGGCSDSSGPGGGGSSGGITIPASWGGTWQITSTPAAPATAGTGETSIEPLCAGLSVEELFGDIGDLGIPIDMMCSGSWNDNVADVTCTASGNIKGCDFNMTLTLDVQKNGESFVGTQTMTLTAGPPCDFNQTESISVMGDRIDTEQFGCGQNLVSGTPTDWSGTWTVTDTPVGSAQGGGMLVCPGDDPDRLFFSNYFGVSTTGGYDGNNAEVFGSWNGGQSGSCLQLVTQRVQAQMNSDGNSFTGTREQTTYSVVPPGGKGPCSGSSTMNYTVTGTRTSSDISSCGTRRLPETLDIELSDLSLDDFRIF